MSCNRNCKNCEGKLVSTSISIASNVVIITVPTQTFENLERRCLIIAQSLPAGSNALPVMISNGGTLIPVRVRTGNDLRADQIRSRRRYKMIYGNDPVHFSLECLVPKTCFTSTPTTTIADE